MQKFNLGRGTEKELSIAELCGIEPERVAMILFAATAVVEYERQVPRLSIHERYRIHDIYEDTICEQQQVMTEEELMDVAVEIAMREIPCPSNRGLQTLCTSGDSGLIAIKPKSNIPKGQNLAIKFDSKIKDAGRFDKQTKDTSNDSNQGGL